jgi:hypothetical protein
MEKASGGRFAPVTRKTDEDEDDSDMALNTHKPWAKLSCPFGPIWPALNTQRVSNLGTDHGSMVQL